MTRFATKPRHKIRHFLALVWHPEMEEFGISGINDFAVSVDIAAKHLMHANVILVIHDELSTSYTWPSLS